MRKTCQIISAVAAVGFGTLTSRTTNAAEVSKPVAAFINRHCADCHCADVTKGGLNLESLTFDPQNPDNFKIWERVWQRVRADEMPPAKKPRPDTTQLKQFTANLGQSLIEADRANIALRGRVQGRRLTRVEYEHTIHDLLGIDLPLKDLLPEDPATHGFQTVASGQQLSHFQLERYLDVADLALKEAFKRASEEDVRYRRFFTPTNLLVTSRGPELREGKSIHWPIALPFYGRLFSTAAPASGWYRIRLQGVQAVNPGSSGAVWGTLRSGLCTGAAPMLYMIGLVEATPEPRDLAFEAWIEKGQSLLLKPDDATLNLASSGGRGGSVSYKGRDLVKQGLSGIAHTGIEMERIYPCADHATIIKNLYGGLDPKAAREKPEESLKVLVAGFAERAFRRPFSKSQLDPYLDIARQSLAGGADFPVALSAAYRAILCSPRFLTFIEAPGRLDDYALATRLSYALWVSLPDAPLLKLAAAGRLHQPAVLEEQVERLLSDAKANRFICSFTDQWLKLNEIDFTTPDTHQFPAFDAVVQESMLLETRAYVTELIRSNLSATCLVDSDFAFVNGRLARHYLGRDKPGRPPSPNNVTPAATPEPGDYGPMPDGFKPGSGLQKIKLKPDARRGGLLTQGAILKVTADGTATSPVKRGVFVNERILGAHIPPPPPGVPAIEPDVRGAVTIRDQLEKHRSNESCAACHRTIDPPGFVLENFDPVGNWRTRYPGEKGAPVDATGVTPDGVSFAGLDAWRQIYSRRGDQLAGGFAEQFLTYATGAPIRFSETTAINEIVAATKKSGYGLRSVIRASILSPVFLDK